MKSIKMNLTTIVVVALIFGLGSLSFLNYYEAKQLLTANLEQSIASLTLSSGSEVGLWLNARKDEMELMANMPFILSGEKDAIISYLNAETQRKNIYEQYFIVDNKGVYYLSSGKMGSVSDRDYFQEVITTGQTVISDPLISRGTDSQVIVVAAPIKKDGKVAGLIGGSVNLTELSQELTSAKVGKLGYAFMVQEDGLIIAHPEQDILMKYNPLHDSNADPQMVEAFRKMTKGESGITRYHFLGTDKYMAYVPVPGVTGVKWSFGITVPASYITNQLRYQPILYFTSVTAVLGILVILLLGRWLVRPLSRLAEITTGLPGKLHEQADIGWLKSPVVEVDSLTNNFRHMAVALQENFQEINSANTKLEAEVAERVRAEENLMVNYEELGATEEELRNNYEELQKKEAALWESERRFRSMLENIQLITVVLDKDGSITFCNDFMLGLTGWQRDEIIGQDYFQVFLPPGMKEEIREVFLKAVSQGEIISHGTHPIQTRKGEYRLVNWNYTLLFDPNGDVVGAASIGVDITERKQAEELFRTLSNSSPIGIYIVQDRRFQFVNPQFQKWLGYTEDELLGQDPLQLILPMDKDRVRENAVRLLKGEQHSFPYEYRTVNKNGEIMWVIETIASIQYKGKRATLGNYIDITEHKLAEKTLQENELRFRTLFEDALNPIFVFDRNGRYIDANRAGLAFFECERDELLTQKHSSLGPGTMEKDYLVNGRNKTLLLNVVSLSVSGKTIYYGIGQDITERKQIEKKLKDLSLHDPLTGLYNRAYFEEEMRRLEGGRFAPVGIVVCDVDGLKLANDTLGHYTGDVLLTQTAGIIGQCFRKEDMISRIGGDEFAILLPKSGLLVVESACHRIQDAVARYNAEHQELPLSLSVGFAVGGETSTNMGDIFKEADNNMYREKLHRSQSARSAIVQTLMKALEARDFITEGHADRLQELVANLAAAIGLPEHKITDLRLLAQFHDIGKVGIPDRILFKSGPLTSEEFTEMRRHSEIGFRIAQSAADLVPIANWVLKHHEWWNGDGYPLGLKGEDIPLECRILAIADAYDAMTSDRPYRKAITQGEAVVELKRSAGTQFDPQLVLKFIQRLERCNGQASN